MLCLVLIAIAAAICYYYLTKPPTYWEERGVKHVKSTWIGNIKSFLFRQENFAEMLIRVNNKFSGARYFGMYQFGAPVLVIKDPELLKQLAVKDFDHFGEHFKMLPEGSDPLWDNNLFALREKKWRNMRPTISPAFTSSKIKAMFLLITECAENFVQHFLSKDEDIVTVEMKDIFSRFTNDAIATTALGVKVDSLAAPTNEFYLMGKKATDLSSFTKALKMMTYILFPKIVTTFGIKVKLFDQDVRDFLNNLVNDTIKTREDRGIVRPDLIHVLMEARKGTNKQEEQGIVDTGFATTQDLNTGKGKATIEITNEIITAQAAGFFFAGFDAISSLMCFTAYELATHDDIQQKLRKEINDTFEACKGKLTYDALLKMKYMDMVVSEVLRKWPNQAATDRLCTKAYTIEPTSPEERPVHLKEGDMVWYPMIAVQRDPENYPDPDRFDPERFSDENKDNIKPYTFYPFGVGPRNCIGSRFALLETKVIFFYTLLHFEIVPVEKSRIPLTLSRGIFTLAAEGGYWFGLKRIQNKN